jgi:glycosyltransferase involved in cell wall biosynthesis
MPVPSLRLTEMRIALVVHTFFPKWSAGTEVYTRSIARKARERGHDVFVICYEPPEANETFEGIRAWDSMLDGLPVHRISFCKPYRFFHLKDYFNLAVEHHISSYLAALKPDIVHVMHAMHLSTASIWAAKQLNLPVVATATDFWYVCPTFQLVKWDDSLCRGPHPLTCLACVTPEPPDSWIRRTARHKLLSRAASPVLIFLATMPFFRRDWLANLLWVSRRPQWMKKTLAQVDVLLAPTANTAGLLTLNGIQPAAMRTSGYGLETLAAPSAPVNREGSMLRVGYIGTFRHTKGLHVLLKAMRSLPSDKVRLQVYGSPGHFPEYDNIVENLAKGLDNVSFRGTFPNEQLPQVFAGLDVLVMPALWYENSPLVILSSFSLKTPVVASNVGSLADLIKHGENGLLFEMGSDRDLAVQLRRLIEDPTLLNRLRAGIPDVRTMDENVEELLEIYSGLTRVPKNPTQKPVERPPSLPVSTLRIGSLIASLRRLHFGAHFGNQLSLLRSQIKLTGDRELSLEFQWHSPELRPEWAVFVHFLDDGGDIQIQADHSLWQYNQDPWGFVTYAFKIWIPDVHLGKSYRARLGVWNPEEKTRLTVSSGGRPAVDAHECAVSLGVVGMFLTEL